MAINKNLDIYEALIVDEDEGVFCISLVDEPAVESNWLAFAKAQQPLDLQFKVADEDEHILLGVIMRADFPIYRVGVSGYEYYIKYSKETIAKMARKMLADNVFNFVDTNHNNQWVDGVLLEELFIKDVSKGINPNGFEDIEDGSLFAKYRVSNEKIWEKVKAGKFNGFSLEGYFEAMESKFIKNPQHNMSLLEKLKKILTEYKSFETREGVTIEVDGEELGVGQVVDVADGEYHTDTVKVKVEQGVITEIETIEPEPMPMPTEGPVVEDMVEEEEPMVEEPEAEPQQSDYEQIKAIVDQLVAEIDAIKSQLAEPCTLPVEEVAKKCEPKKQFNSRQLEIAEALRKMK